MSAQKRTWPSPAVRHLAYGMMSLEHNKISGAGVIYPPPATNETPDAYTDRKVAAYTRYVCAAIDKLNGMAQIVGLIEDKTTDEILMKVRGY